MPSLGIARIDPAALIRFLVGGDVPAVIAEAMSSDEAERPLLDLVSLAHVLHDFGLPVRGARIRGRWRTTVWGWILAPENPMEAESGRSFVFLCPDGRLLRVAQVRGRLVVAGRTDGRAPSVTWEATPTALVVAREWLMHHLPLEPWVPQPRQPSGR